MATEARMVDPMPSDSRFARAFVIVAQPRSGSTLLADALHQHPRITCHDELFTPKWVHGYRPRDEESAAVDHETLLAERNEDPEQFLLERVLHEADDQVQVGFKVVYSDIFSGDPLARFLRLFIIENRIRVIHLRRLNLLRCFISVERMSRLGIAHSHNSAPQDSSLHLKEDDFLRFVLNQQGNSDFISRSMNVIAHPRYEHLPQGYRECIEALGVPRRPFQANLSRMSSHSLAASIADAERWNKWDFPRSTGFAQYTD